MISERGRKISPSPTLTLNAKVKELREKGEDIVNLTAGEPDFPTPERIKEACRKALKDNFTHYTSPWGILPLREAIKEKFWRENHIDYPLEGILVTCGAKDALYLLFQTLLNPGEEVIIFSPYWVSYPEQVKLAGGVPVIISTGEDFLPDLEEVKKKVSSRTRAIIINSPCNPTGKVYPPQILEKLAEIVWKRRIFLISDEVYEKIVFGERPVSPASLFNEIKDFTITVNAVSKTYSMTGWRIGYVGGPPEVVKVMAKIQSQSVSCPSSLSQAAALEALRGGEEEVEEMVREFRRRRDYLVRELEKFSTFQLLPPEGTFYAFPHFNFEDKDSEEFSMWLLERARVAMVPGSAFGKDNHVRISFATSLSNLEKAIYRLKRLLP